MNVEFQDYVEDMLDAMDKAESLLQDISYEQFAGDFRIHFCDWLPPASFPRPDTNTVPP